jgi:hypothetical protein
MEVEAYGKFYFCQIFDRHRKVLSVKPEEFRSLQEYPRYKISSLGRVLSVPTQRIIKPTLDRRSGWMLVCLIHEGQRTTTTVARLVCENFLEPPEIHHNSILHRDADRTNCEWDNLAWKPRWFVTKYMREMHLYAHHVRRPFVSLDTNEVFETHAEFASKAMVLPSTVLQALMNGRQTIYFGYYGEIVYI